MYLCIIAMLVLTVWRILGQMSDAVMFTLCHCVRGIECNVDCVYTNLKANKSLICLKD